MLPKDVIPAFDAFLASRGLRLEAVVIGGAALNLLGVVERETKDCDVLDPELSPEIIDAANAFAVTQSDEQNPLRRGWLNNGPSSLASALPAGWQERLELLYSGTALVLFAPSRFELLLSKLFALCDRGIDEEDCVALAPTVEELTAARGWLAQQDTNEMWSDHVDETLAVLGQRLGYGV